MAVDDAVTIEFRNVLGRFPSGVVVVTGSTRGGPTGLTIQSFMALSLDPTLILVSIDRDSTSWPAISTTGQFAVNILADNQQALAVAFARSGGNKFHGVEFAPGPLTRSPLLHGCQAWIECEIWQSYEGGDHEIVTARVLGLRASEDPKLHPLVFFRSKFPRFDREHWDSIY